MKQNTSHPSQTKVPRALFAGENSLLQKSPAARMAVLIPLVVSCCFLNAGCDTEEGVKFAHDNLPVINFNGPGFHGRVRIPDEMLKSNKLKFQEAVVRSDTNAAARHIKSEYVNQSIKGYPPVFYAAINGNSSMVRLLVQHGASVGRHIRGKSLAFIAAANGHTRTADDLVVLGGGSSSDVTSGHGLYAENQAIQRRETAEFTAGVLSILKAASASNSSNGSSSGFNQGYSIGRSLIQSGQETAENMVDPMHLMAPAPPLFGF